MQAIVTPNPDAPVSFTRIPPVDEHPSQSSRWRRRLIICLVAVAAFSAGLLIPNRAQTPPAPDLAATLQWMFDAGLAHEAVTMDGATVPAAVPGVTVEDVEVVDARRGPIMAIVSDPATGLAAYRITVERSDLDWSVTATRLD